MTDDARTHRAALGARCAWPLLGVCALAALAGAAGAQAATGGASQRRRRPKPRPAAASPSRALRYGRRHLVRPGLYGKQTACGQTLRPGTLGVAHSSLPCGTAVKFVYRGRQVVTRVIDRGPYAKGCAWDLTNGAREALGFEGSGRVRYAVGRAATRDRSD